jgi:hypothetical protein
VLRAIQADVIVRHEHREEVGFQSLSATTGPTHAKEIRLPLQVRVTAKVFPLFTGL